MPSSYTTGTVIRITGAFVDVISGDPIDPTEVCLGLKINQTSPLTYNYAHGNAPAPATTPVVRTGTGLYYVQFDTTGFSGTWQYLWGSTGVAQVIGGGGSIAVVDPAFPIAF